MHQLARDEVHVTRRNIFLLILFSCAARATEEIALKVNRVRLVRLVPRASQDFPVQPYRQNLKR